MRPPSRIQRHPREDGNRSLTLGWFHGLLWLTRADFNRMVRAPSSLYFFLGTIGFLGFIYWFTSTWAVSLFLDFVYVTLPILFLAIASTLISRERESGFSGILFTHPLGSGQYYAAKLLSLQLLTGLYLVALAPFDVLIVSFGGPGWVDEILARIGWTLLTTLFVGALGLLISASLGRRATLPSVSLGFAIALMLVFGPFLLIQYLGALDPSTVPRALALLHVSPAMGAMDIFHSHGLELSLPFLPVLVTGFLTAFLVLAGFLVFTRFQSPEGWEAPPYVRVGISVLVLVVLIATPLAVPFAYDRPEEPGGSNTFVFGEILVNIGGFTVVSETLRVGDTLDTSLNISVSNGGSLPVTMERLDLRWRSEHFEFNTSAADLGPFEVPPIAGGGNVNFTVPVRVTAVQVAVLGGSPLWSAVTPVVIEIHGEMQGTGFTYVYRTVSLQAVGLDYNRDTAWVVIGVLAAAALGLRAVGRLGRRRT